MAEAEAEAVAEAEAEAVAGAAQCSEAGKERWRRGLHAAMGQTQMGKENEACWSCMHGRPTGLFITASPLAFAFCFLLQPLELPLPLQLLTVPLLSSQPFSWGLRLQNQGQGVHTGALGAHFEIHPQNHNK